MVVKEVASRDKRLHHQQRAQHDVPDQIILDTERFKGNIAAPKGTFVGIVDNN